MKMRTEAVSTFCRRISTGIITAWKLFKRILSKRIWAQ